MQTFWKGLGTGMLLQLAVGPVFFLLMNIVIARSTADGLMGVVAVTLADFIFIAIAISGSRGFLRLKSTRRTFAIVSSTVLIIFGAIIVRGTIITGGPIIDPRPDLLASFLSVFLLTLSNPLTLLFLFGLFTTKALEADYTKHEMYMFALGTGFATIVFMLATVIVFAEVRHTIPVEILRPLNVACGAILFTYGAIRGKRALSE